MVGVVPHEQVGAELDRLAPQLDRPAEAADVLGPLEDVTSTPARLSASAAPRPAGPAPSTATVIGPPPDRRPSCAEPDDQ